MKYIVHVEEHINCPIHGPGPFSRGLMFFKSIKDLLIFAKDNLNNYNIDRIYRYNKKTDEARDLTEHDTFKLSYDYGRHVFNGVKFQYKGFKFRTKYDGKGNLIWCRE